MKRGIPSRGLLLPQVPLPTGFMQIYPQFLTTLASFYFLQSNQFPMVTEEVISPSIIDHSRFLLESFLASYRFALKLVLPNRVTVFILLSFLVKQLQIFLPQINPACIFGFFSTSALLIQVCTGIFSSLESMKW